MDGLPYSTFDLRVRAVQAVLNGTPITQVADNRGSISALSAISPQGRLVFRVHDKWIASGEVIDFLGQLLRHHPGRDLVVVVDQAPPHTSKKTINHINSQSRLHVFHLPTYSPDRNRATLHDLEGGHFIDTHHPDALFGESSRIALAPKDLLCPLFEPPIQARCLPIPRPMGLPIGIPTGLLSLGGHLLTTHLHDSVVLIGHCLAVVFYFWAAAMIVASLFRRQVLSPDSVFGVICGYLLLGMAWGVLYSTLDTAWPGSFQVGDRLAEQVQAGHSRIHLFTYYSFITLTTVGYGDVTPLSTPARTCAWLEALTGQFYLAVLVAGLVGALLSKKEEASDKGESRQGKPQ